VFVVNPLLLEATKLVVSFYNENTLHLYYDIGRWEDVILNISEKSHRQFHETINDEVYRKNIVNLTPKFVKKFEKIIENNNGLNVKKDIAFVKAILIEARSNYYMIYNSDSKAFILTKRNFKGVMIIGHYTPVEILKDYFKGYEKVIELVHIHSAKKGEGRKMMKTILKFKKDLEIPIMLWAETDDNAHYFENYGFKNYGRKGNEDEHLLILK